MDKSLSSKIFVGLFAGLIIGTAIQYLFSTYSAALLFLIRTYSAQLKVLVVCSYH